MAQVNITLNEEELLDILSGNRDKAFKKMMEKILNEVLLAESTEQIGASKHERTEERSDYRNGSRERDLVTRIGRITLRVPRHRNQPFTTMIFDNYKRSEAALISAMTEMVVNGVSTRKVSKVVHTLCGSNFSKSTVSELCKSLDAEVSRFRNRDLSEMEYPFLVLDATYFKVRENHRIVSKALMIALGINTKGHCEIIGVNTYDNESTDTWKQFLQSLKERNLTGIKMITSDAHQGCLHAIAAMFKEVPWQRCQFHFIRNIMDSTPKKYQAGLQSELKEMFNCGTIEEARRRMEEILNDYEDVAEKAMDILEEGFEDAMTVMALPQEFRKPLRTSNMLERINAELKRRSFAIRIFPNEPSLLRIMGAVLMEYHEVLQLRRKIFFSTTYQLLTDENHKELKRLALKQHQMLYAA